MLINEINNIKETKKDLRKFGITVGTVLLIIAAILLWNDKQSAWWFIYTGAFLVVTGLAVPVILKPLNKAWMILALLLGWVMTRVILTILFFLVLTPISLIAKLVGKKFLDLKSNQQAVTYWESRPSETLKPENYERQF